MTDKHTFWGAVDMKTWVRETFKWCLLDVWWYTGYKWDIPPSIVRLVWGVVVSHYLFIVSFRGVPSLCQLVPVRRLSLAGNSSQTSRDTIVSTTRRVMFYSGFTTTKSGDFREKVVDREPSISFMIKLWQVVHGRVSKTLTQFLTIRHRYMMNSTTLCLAARDHRLERWYGKQFPHLSLTELSGFEGTPRI